MSFKASFLYAKKIIISRGTKKTTGKKSIFGAILCIALSLIPLVVVLSISDAMVNGMTDRLINLSSAHLQLQYDFIGEENINKELLDVAVDVVKNVPGVTESYVMITTIGLAASSKARCGATVKACKPEIFKNVSSYTKLFSAVEGNIEDFYNLNNRNVLIGKGIADKLQLKSGDNIRIITTQKVNDKILPKMNSFKVCAVISCGYQELDALWVFVPVDYALDMVKPDTSVASIMIETAEPFGKQGQLRQVQRNVEEATGFMANSYRWDELNQSQYENFASTKMLLVFIMLLIVLVACVNISSCLVMLSLERRKEIAILKSVGTSNSTISMAFIFVGIMIGLAGILIGIPTGIIISLNINHIVWAIEQVVNIFARLGYFIGNGNLNSFYEIHLMDEAYYLESIPVHIPFIQILFYIVATLVLSLLTSLIPAIKAGKEKTIDTFRKAGA